VVLFAGWAIVESRKPGLDEVAGLPADQFEKRVRDYLLEHPEVILESVQRLQDQERAGATNRDQAAIAAHAGELFRDPATPVGGDPEGDVTLVEFFDYNCPYCRKVAPSMEAVERNDPGLRIAYKEFPILGPNSEFAARAALAANRQGKYVELHKTLMSSDGVVDEARVLGVAAELGIDLTRLKTDMDDPAIAAAISRNLDLAQALRINGTPGFVIGEQVFRGATETATLNSLIERARSRGANSE
jgi:protein-disulfide isomerase